MDEEAGRLVGEKSSRPTHIRRSRVPVSCTFCRTGKLRCDRKSPCQQCTKRNRDGLCRYSTDRKVGSSSIQSLQQRLQHLEYVLKNAVTAPSTAEVTLPLLQEQPLGSMPANKATDSLDALNCSPNSALGTPDGVYVSESGHVDGAVVNTVKDTVYIGATHWAALLNDVRNTGHYEFS